MIKNYEEFNVKSEKCAECLKTKFSGADGKRHILICGGTGCLSTGAAAIKEEFEKKIVEKGLQDKVDINQVGCFGMCSQGPFIKIFPEETLYRMLKVEDVEEILSEDIGNGKIVERLLYVDPVSKQKIVKQDDIPFYKKQVHIALHAVGSIDPEDINEALAAGAFKGLVRALSMDRKEVIDEILNSGLRGR
ncbi:MAG: NAD(P)H-dependent oxidoreductase subunit E, partial [Clostridia bacterium]|nr:NAD(P)H-dependent oxidoreductase subunit E [Clostridia bacterium]